MVIMKTNKKVVLIIALCIGIVFGVFGLVYLILNPKTSTEEVMIYNYSFQPGLTYEVHLIENELYDDTIQEEGAIYIKNLLDYIKVDFSTSYQGSEVIPLDMEYMMNASVIGYSSNNDSRLDYWKKDFPLLEKQTIHMESDNIQEEETLKLELARYENFAQEANKITGVNLSTELVISMIGNITAITPSGMKETPFDITMSIPLQENLFEIKKGDMQSTSEKFTDSIVHTLPLDIKYIVLIGIIITLLIIGVLSTIFFIYEPSLQEILRSEVKKIVNNHGSRMVALGHSPGKTFEHTYEVTSIKDLLILSDEMQKPIYYIADENEFVKDNVFHVEDKGDLYIYKHTTAYNKGIYYNERIDDIIEELQQDDGDESSEYQLPNS